MGPWHPLGPADAGWAGTEYVYVLGGVVQPRLDRLRDAVLRLHDGDVLDRWYDLGRARMRPVGPAELSDRVEDMVRASDLVAPGLAAAEAATGPALGSLPVRLVLGPGWLAVRFSHAFADGWSALQLVGHLVRQAVAPTPATADQAGDGTTPWQVVPPWTQELVNLRAVLGHPRTLLTAVSRRAEFRGGEYASVARAGVTRDPVRAAYVSDAGLRSRLSALRDERHPGASTASLVITMLREELVRGGVVPDPGTEVVFDVRRAHAATRSAFGNFIAPITVRAEDDDDPASVAEQLRRTQASGLPVVALAGRRLRGRASHEPDGTSAPMVRVATERPRLAVSYLGRHGPLEALPWDPGATPYLAVATTPNGPGSIGVTTHELPGDRLSLSVSCYDDFVDGVAVRRAVETVARGDRVP